MAHNLVTFPQASRYQSEISMIEEEPQGFFPLERTTNWGAFRYVIASAVEEILEQLELIEVESDPDSSTEYLVDWERMLGLPEAPASESLEDRRAAVGAALKQSGFTRTTLRTIVESYLTSSAAGDPPKLTPTGIPIGAGIPLFSGIADIDDAYLIWEDVESYEYNIRLDSAVTLPNTGVRAIEKFTPAGITANITYHGEPRFNTNQFSEPEMDNLPTDSSVPGSGWQELSTEQVFVGTNSLKIFPKGIDQAGAVSNIWSVGSKTFANSISGTRMKIWIPKNVWPTGHLRFEAEAFTNNQLYSSNFIDLSKTEQWQELDAFWIPGADFTGNIHLVYDGANRPPGIDDYLIDGTMESATTSSWSTNGTNTLAKVLTPVWRGIRSMECTHQDHGNLLFQSFTLDADNQELNQNHVWYMRVYIPTASNPTTVRFLAWDFGFEPGSGATAQKDFDNTLKDQWQTLKMEFKMLESIKIDPTGQFYLQAFGLSPGDKIYVDSCSAVSGNDLHLYIDDVEMATLG